MDRFLTNFLWQLFIYSRKGSSQKNIFSYFVLFEMSNLGIGLAIYWPKRILKLIFLYNFPLFLIERNSDLSRNLCFEWISVSVLHMIVHVVHVHVIDIFFHLFLWMNQSAHGVSVNTHTHKQFQVSTTHVAPAHNWLCF